MNGLGLASTPTSHISVYMVLKLHLVFAILRHDTVYVCILSPEFTQVRRCQNTANHILS